LKFQFPNKPVNEILDAIKKAMEGRQISDLVKLDSTADKVTVSISKLGTSVLTFLKKNVGENIELSLDSEKIAFAHKAFYGEVKEKLISIIEKAGGKISK